MAFTHPLAGVIEKLRNADEHLHRLHAAAQGYLEGELKGTIQSEYDPDDATRGHLRFIVLQQPPLRLATIVGDVVHNLRCSLDYIVEELVKRNGHVTTVQHQFPICVERTAFEKAVTSGRLRGVEEAAVRAINECQPFHAPQHRREDHSLRWLHLLSNQDKHRVLAVSALNAGLAWQLVAKGGRALREGRTTEPVRDGEILATVPVEFVIDGQRVQLQSKLSIGIGFEEPTFKNFDVLGSLQTIREHIGKAVFPKFTDFFLPLPEQLRLTSHGVLTTPAVEMMLLARPNSQPPTETS